MRKVFFVDDEPLIAQGLKSITDWQELEIHLAGSASDGVQALEILRQEPVDLLITDIMMPRMNGLELIQKVKEISPETKFIVLSGHEEFDYVKKGISLGIENYILKPINIEELESTIRHIRADWAREELAVFHFEEDRTVLRNNVLQRWAAGEIELLEFKQRARLLGIPADHKYYQACIFRLVSEQPSRPEYYRMNGLAEECARRARESLPLGQEVIGFPDGDEDIVVLYASAEPMDPEVIRAGAEIISKLIHERTQMRVWSSEGTVGSNFSGVQISYDSAKSAYGRLIISGERAAEHIGAGQLEEAKSDFPLWGDEQFAKLWIEGSREAVAEFIETVMADRGGKELLPRQPYVNTAIRLMLASRTRDKNTDYHELISPLPRINTLKALREHVKRVVIRNMTLAETVHEEFSPHVAFLMKKVEMSYAEDLSLKTLSQKLDLHPNYLGQLFQQEVGVSFSDYVNHYRIEKATQLLLHTDQKTADIAADVGYLDTSYFYRQFKKYAGVSPTELRNMYVK
ncbi:response regulator transcription factor [Paenibacillus tuaregi]|uniref:response regulator transcription factor n=1 Tax=Paenibacillus tuaregi TaxID=1816681 RepID=UPI00083970B4|nr:response regulator transcription factor [Paenibacillus tuaregi]